MRIARDLTRLTAATSYYLPRHWSVCVLTQRTTGEARCAVPPSRPDVVACACIAYTGSVRASPLLLFHNAERRPTFT